MLENFAQLINGFSVVLDPQNLGACCLAPFWA